MTRFLSLLILFLHTVSDLRRRTTLVATATVLLVAATVIVASTVVVDAASNPRGARYSDLQGKIVTQLHSVESFSSLIHNKHVDTAMLRTVTKKKAANVSASLKVAEVPKELAVAEPPVADAVQEQGGTLAADGVTSGPTATPMLAPPRVGPAIQLASSATTCKQGQRWVDIPSAQLTWPNPLSSDTSLVWYWETRIEGDSTVAVPPISSDHINQTIAAGATVVTLNAADATQPLLSAPVGIGYTYNVRLHITAPFDLASGWVSVPQSPAPCQ